MAERPLVSVIIPSFNQGRYIRETIDSVLGQDYRPLEVLVLDGGSTDETVDVLRSYGEIAELRWWSEPDRGVVDAVNKGLARATGSIQAIQSSDDTYLPGAITTVVAAFEQRPDLGLVYGDVEYIDAASNHVGGTSLPPFDLGEYVGKLTFIPQPSAFFTKVAADAVGGWRPEISYAADADFYLRIVARWSAAKLDGMLGRYRYHEEQRDRAGIRIARDWEAAVHDWLRGDVPPALRRRAAAGIHLTHAHYSSDSQWAKRTMELYRALWIDPWLIRRHDFPRRELIPGRQPIWKLLSRIKRALGLAPRR
jgi:glycosyltransferase involved in cell wall biosynthesis